MSKRSTTAYTVLCADKATGDEFTLEFTAENPEGAARYALKRGYLVSKVEPIPGTTTRVKGSIICPNPNCTYIGKPTRKARGDILVGIVLTLFFLLPGILYFMLRSGYRYSCPNCGLQIAVDN